MDIRAEGASKLFAEQFVAKYTHHRGTTSSQRHCPERASVVLKANGEDRAVLTSTQAFGNTAAGAQNSFAIWSLPAMRGGFRVGN